MFEKTTVRFFLAAALTASALAAEAGTVNIDMVTVGDPGNVTDTNQHSGGDNPTGAVGYIYQIGEFDVTNNQYAAFLGDVAAGSDPYGLWNGSMQSDANGGIDRTGSGPYSYAVKSDQGNQPVVDVSFYDAVRFVNWLSNGQPTGAEGNGTTESGTYLITGGGNDSGTVTIPSSAQRAVWAAGGSGVHWLLPSEDEWYKAAYYVGGGTKAGYWTYPTGSNTAPTSQAPPGGTNSANFISTTTGFVLTGSTTYSTTTDYLTDVGAYSNTVSPYGAFDMGGDVWQWNEADINGDGTTRGIRGGSFDNDAVRLASTYDTDIGYAADEFDDTGFRVASVGAVPQPGRVVLWASAVSGKWSDSTKWTGGAAPNAVGAGAALSASTTAALTVTLDEPVTLGALLLGSGSASRGYTLSGSGSNTLTFSNSGNYAPAQISVSDGAHYVDAPVVLASDLVVTSTSSNPWTLNFGTAGSITDSGGNLSLTMSTGNGTLILSGSDNYTGGTIVEAGTLIVTGTDALAAGMSLTVGADATSIFDASQANSSLAVSPGVAAVPEPSTCVLWGIGVIGLIVTATRVRLRCQYGCSEYGQCLTCPPHSPPPETTRKMLDEYSLVLVE